MPTYTTHFSFTVDCDDPAARIAEIRAAYEAASEPPEGYDWDSNPIFSEDESFGLPDMEDQGPCIWFSDDAGESNIDTVLAIVHWLLATDPSTPDEVTVQWSNDCSRPVDDAYGGGTALVLRHGPGDIEDLWLNTSVAIDVLRDAARWYRQRKAWLDKDWNLAESDADAVALLTKLLNREEV